MTNRNDLTAYTSALVNLSENAELQERLNLYQVFLKLYNHHRNLLDEILDLEHLSNRSVAGAAAPYVQGFVSAGDSYLVTNLLRGKTQALTQPEQIWLIGRDPKRASIPVQDIRLSRCHAAIKYIAEQGFYLIDLGSRNQSFVNGEPVRQALLKDGDQVRLGSLSFTFLFCQSAKLLPSLLPEMLKQVEHYQAMAAEALELSHSLSSRTEGEEDGIPTLDLYHETSSFLRSEQNQ